MRFFLSGPWKVPISIFLILSLSKDALHFCNHRRLGTGCARLGLGDKKKI
jgi:hypothetical protein